MADREDTPGSGSPLSDIDSDEFNEEMKSPRMRSRSDSDASTVSDAPSDTSATPSASTPRHMDMPPAKRRRVGAANYDHITSISSLMPPGSPAGSISSDSSGSVPTSPSFAHLGPTHPLSTAYAAAQAHPDNPDKGDYVQITRCEWTDCSDPEQGNMDNLVAHINEIHIPPRQKKYYCEWEGCSRKSMPHTSAYALKAHMRSHTREKPFLCALPECDRSFTRSDALAKHMRTVHETEALRPSDPVPRGHTGGISTGGPGSVNGAATKVRSIKLRMNGQGHSHTQLALSDLPPLPRKVAGLYIDRPLATKQQHEHQDTDLVDAVDLDQSSLVLPVDGHYYPKEIFDDMDEYEKSLPPSQYFRLLRRQIQWAQQESDMLHKQLVDLRGTTDDLRGNVVRKTVSNEPSTRENGTVPQEERIGDDVRRDEWVVTESLLDSLLKAEMISFSSAQLKSEAEGESADSKMTGVNGTAEDALTSNRVRTEMDADSILKATNPWDLLKSLKAPLSATSATE